jgi:hypothetical protein
LTAVVGSDCCDRRGGSASVMNPLRALLARIAQGALDLIGAL